MGDLGTDSKLTQQPFPFWGQLPLEEREAPPHKFSEAPTPHLWLGAILRS